jgi:hypothetical protein
MRCLVKVTDVQLCIFFASVLGIATALNAAERPKASTPVEVSANADFATGDAAKPDAAQSHAAQSYGDLPLSFEENRGQSDQRVRFLSRGAGYTFFLTPGEAVLAFSQDQAQSHAAVLHLQLAGSNAETRIGGADPLPGNSNYFLGQDPAKWRTGVPTYRKVAYENIYPGINLVYYGNQRQLEYDFVVAPGADPRLIRLAVEGAGKLALDAQGNLVLGAGEGEVRLLAPRIYQDLDGERREIAGRWNLEGKNTAGFRLGAYDHKRALVIDPVLVYSSFLGGSQKNSLSRIAIDSAGNAYVAGFTASGDFPTAPTPQAVTFGGGSSQRGVFVAKIDPTGSTLLYSTYLSGSANEQATGLTLDASGNAYVTGDTTSSDFPVRNAFQSTCAANPSTGACSNAFLTKISSTGDALLYSTYLGGTGADSATSVAVDSKGNAYVVGATSSSDFPATAGALQTKCGGGCIQNAFLAKFNATGESLFFSTYLGGSASDSASDIALDSAGNAYVTGQTTSADFPLANAFQKTCASATGQAAACVATAFVAKIKADGLGLAYSTYLGGSLGSQGTGIAVDSLGSAYVTGNTQSADFPVLKAFQPACGIDAVSGKCSVDTFLSKFTPTGKALVYSTYLGGSGRDEASGIVLDTAGNAHIVGRTESADFPTTKPLQSNLHGASDAFVATFNAAGNALLFSTYHGGSATEAGKSIALDAKGNLYIAGETSSPDFPTSHPFQSSCAGACNNAFVSKMTPALPPGSTASSTGLTASPNPSVFGESVTFTATVTGSAGTPTGTVTFKNGATILGSNTLDPSGVATFSTSSLSTASHSITGVYGGDSTYAGSTSPVVTQVVNQASSKVVLTSSVNPSSVGQSVKFTATVSAVLPGSGTPTGTVDFTSDGTAITGCTGVPLTSAVATCTTSTLTAGTHSIVAAYGGDLNFLPDTSAIFSQVVKSTTTTALASDANPSTFNQLVTFTATVTSSGGTPTGTVTFMDGAATLGTGTLSAGVATFSISTLSVTTHSITAVYGGNANFAGSTSAILSQVVNQASTTTTVTSSANPSSFNQSVTFTATVTGANGGTPSGTVTFKDGVTTLGTGTLSAGKTTFSTAALAVGTHSITAVYAGDTNFTGSTSAILSQVVNQATTSVSLTSSLNPSTVNQSVTFTATVTSTNGTPTGTVTFNDNGTAISGAVTINGSGVATFSISSLVASTHPITATYSGDADFSGNTSPTLQQTVTKSATATTVASSLNPSTVNQSVTFTATVTPASSGTINPGGTVTFKDGTTSLGTGTLNGSLQATFSTAALAIGTHSITAVYGGDSNFTGSTSSALTQTINQTTTTTAVISSANPSTINESVTFTATVTPAVSGVFAPTGTVTFKDGSATLGTGTLNSSLQASFTTAGLALGSHSITAVYGGDSSFITSTSPVLAQVVDQQTTTTVLAGVVHLDQTITFTATVAPTITGVFVPSGTVTFMDGSTTLGSGKLTNLQATFTTTAALSPGNHQITAVYSGDLNFLGSTSQPLLVAFTTETTPPPVIAGGQTNPQALANAAANGTQVTYSCLSLTGTGIAAPLPPTSPGVFSSANNGPPDVSCYFSATSETAPAAPNLTICTEIPQPTSCSDAGTLGIVLPQHETGPRLVLYSMATGLPGIVIFGLATFGAPRKKLTRTSATRFLGIAILTLLLISAAACGGGFTAKIVNPSSPAGTTPAGTYSLTVLGTGTDGSLQIYTVPFTVSAP